MISKRIAPVQTWKGSKVRVGGDPFASGLKRNCRQKCIRYQVSGKLTSTTRTREDIPVMLSRRNRNSLRLSPNRVCEIECHVNRGGEFEDSGIGHDMAKGGQDKIGIAGGSFAVQLILEPLLCPEVQGRAFTKRIYKDVDVTQYHVSSMVSSNAAESFKSMPGWTPSPLKTGRHNPFGPSEKTQDYRIPGPRLDSGSAISYNLDCLAETSSISGGRNGNGMATAGGEEQAQRSP